jgi:hypothetical protein
MARSTRPTAPRSRPASCAGCTAIPAGELCWTGEDEDGDGIEDEITGIWDFEITQQLVQARIGTDLAPIRMVYSIACFHEGMNWAWQQVGAYVASGTLAINFFPTFFGGFADAWNTGSSYASSVTASDTAFDRGLVYTFMQGESATFNCDDIGDGVWEETLNVLGTNPCARDFFVDDGDLDEAEFNIGDDYDATQSGATNMELQSWRWTAGDGTIRKFIPATLSW